MSPTRSPLSHPGREDKNTDRQVEGRTERPTVTFIYPLNKMGWGGLGIFDYRLERFIEFTSRIWTYISNGQVAETQLT